VGDIIKQRKHKKPYRFRLKRNFQGGSLPLDRHGIPILRGLGKDPPFVYQYQGKTRFSIPFHKMLDDVEINISPGRSPGFRGRSA